MDIRHLFSVTFFLIGLIVYFGLKYYYLEKGTQSTSHYEATITVFNNEELISRILTALKEAQFGEVVFDQEQHKFFALTKKTMSSFGEFLSIEMIILDQSTVQLNFRSQCNYPFQVYAWGKNKKNYDRFQSELFKLIV